MPLRMRKCQTSHRSGAAGERDWIDSQPPKSSRGHMSVINGPEGAGLTSPTPDVLHGSHLGCVPREQYRNCSCSSQKLRHPSQEKLEVYSPLGYRRMRAFPTSRSNPPLGSFQDEDVGIALATSYDGISGGHGTQSPWYSVSITRTKAY